MTENARVAKPKLTPPSRRRTYYIEERNDRLYVYYRQVSTVDTLFDIKATHEQAEQAIAEHKAGKHPTQKSYLAE